jgi:hypothetical protein
MSRLDFILSLVRGKREQGTYDVPPPNVSPLWWSDTKLLVEEIERLRDRVNKTCDEDVNKYDRK